MTTRVILFFFAVVLAPFVVSAQSTTGSQTSSDQPAQPKFAETVEVVGATPLHGVGVERDKIPANVQVATSDDLARTQSLYVGEQLLSGLASTHVNETQSNPFQPDIQFRGFTASPLLGLPQGLAIYQDGVRMNEPFGDTVNWDILPTNAIASVNLMPGSNALFGQNALGGAVSLQTKTGFSHPGHAASVSSGSFGRQWVDLQTAGRGDRFSYFITGRALAEDGWRDHSPSHVNQVFGSVEWRATSTTLTASATGGANRLTGNGPAPIQLIEADREAIFTYPDETDTDMGLISLRGRHTVSAGVSLDGVAYYRPARTRTFNGDDSAYDECEDDGFDGLLCSADGEGDPVLDQFGQPVAANDDDPLDATNNTSKTRTNGWGGAFQATVTPPLAGRANHLVVGVSMDGGGSRYASDTELARLTDDRGTEGTGLLDAAATVRLKTTVRHAGVYAADFFSVTPRLTIMGAARFNHSVVNLSDQIDDDLTGDHSFTRLNPNAGITYALPRGMTAFGSFSMASRAPTPSELSCADPEDPCRLPNAFISDPPLEQVVSRTWEAGARGRIRGMHWAAATFRTTNRDDLIFISSGALTNQGHFENVGDTLRRGLELSAFGAAVNNTVRWSAAYTYLRATFETPLTLSSPNHPDEVDGEINVRAGDAIPSIPRHNLKADLSVTAGRATVGGMLATTSSQFFRGDEASLLETVDSWAVVNLFGRYELHRRAHLFARITNLFNTDYETFGLLGEADEVFGDDYDDPRFLSPGAPRAAWIGVEFSF